MRLPDPNSSRASKAIIDDAIVALAAEGSKFPKRFRASGPLGEGRPLY